MASEVRVFPVPGEPLRRMLRPWPARYVSACLECNESNVQTTFASYHIVEEYFFGARPLDQRFQESFSRRGDHKLVKGLFVPGDFLDVINIKPCPLLVGQVKAADEWRQK